MSSISRKQYADMYGPTVGDRIRLADTDLIIEIEKGQYLLWHEAKIRRRQNTARRDGTVKHRADAHCPDTVITNCVIVDYWGIVKADIGIKDWKDLRHWFCR